MKTTYMDYSATTYVKPEVLDAMMPFFTEKFGAFIEVGNRGGLGLSINL